MQTAADMDGDVRERLHMVAGDMSALPLPTEALFQQVIIPYNGILCLLEEEQMVRCLADAANHLAPGGKLLFDFYYVPVAPLDHVPKDEEEEGEEEHAHSFVMTLLSQDQMIDVFERQCEMSDPDRFDAEYIYRIQQADKSVEEKTFRIPQRCLYVDQVAPLLHAAGLQVEEMLSDFKPGEITIETGQVVVVASAN